MTAKARSALLTRSWLMMLAMGVCLLGIDISEARVGGGHSFRSSSTSTPTSSSRSSGSSSYTSSSSRDSSSGWSDESDSSSSRDSTTDGDGWDSERTTGRRIPAESFLPVVLILSVLALIALVTSLQTKARSTYSSLRRDVGSAGAERYTTSTHQFLANLADEQRVKKVSASLAELVHHDPNFSEVLFLDFAYSLYSRLNEARGADTLAKFQPYLGFRAKESLERIGRGTGLLKDVTGVIVGSARIESVQIRARDVLINVAFETNYTEHREATSGSESIVFAGPETAFYCEETWVFQRLMNVLSPTPARISRIGCPSCGAPLKATESQACLHCNQITIPASFHWCVSGITVHKRDSQPPTLTASAPEQGTQLPTIFDSNYSLAREQFMASSPEFSWHHAQSRFEHIFQELQQAWSTLDWERSRPFETNQLFQTHLFWIEEYKRQQLRNVLTDIRVETIQLVKIRQDAYFDAMTVRVFASLKDSTVDTTGRVICGDPYQSRSFTEYWTFVRRRGITESNKPNDACPNCGAPLRVNMSGICNHCDGNICSGEFDWVLSRIEQDEVYAG